MADIAVEEVATSNGEVEPTVNDFNEWVESKGFRIKKGSLTRLSGKFPQPSDLMEVVSMENAPAFSMSTKGLKRVFVDLTQLFTRPFFITTSGDLIKIDLSSEEHGELRVSASSIYLIAQRYDTSSRSKLSEELMAKINTQLDGQYGLFYNPYAWGNFKIHDHISSHNRNDAILVEKRFSDSKGLIRKFLIKRYPAEFSEKTGTINIGPNIIAQCLMHSLISQHQNHQADSATES